MTTKHDCSGKIWGAYRDVSGRVYRCSRPATVERDGKWYCWQHDPERVKTDKERRRAAARAELDRHHAIFARNARNARLAELVMPELAELLERLADYARQAAHAAKGYPDDVNCAYNDEEITRELTARIREALEMTE